MPIQFIQHFLYKHSLYFSLNWKYITVTLIKITETKNEEPIIRKPILYKNEI